MKPYARFSFKPDSVQAERMAVNFVKIFAGDLGKELDVQIASEAEFTAIHEGGKVVSKRNKDTVELTIYKNIHAK